MNLFGILIFLYHFFCCRNIHLSRHVKIKVLNNCELSPKELMKLLCEKTGADPVQVIGRILIVYRKSSKKDFKHIELL